MKKYGGGSAGGSKSKKKGQPRSRKDVVCWNCKESGHFKNQCPKPIVERQKEVNMAADLGDALICCVESAVEAWVMDYGALFHACFRRELMRNFRRYKTCG